MSKIFKLLSILHLFVVPILCDKPPVFHCETLYENCKLNNVYLTRKSPHFVPQATNASQIVELEIKSQYMEVVTSDICNAFPKLQILNLENLAIKEIEKNAFENCTYLTYINLSNNSLTSIDVETFMHNKMLTKMDLSKNPIVQLDANIFRNLQKLRDLDLSQMKLFDIDMEKITEFTLLKSPKLDYNNILCDRLAAMYGYHPYPSYCSEPQCILSKYIQMKEMMKVNMTDRILQAKLEYLYEKIMNDDNIQIPIWAIVVAGAVGVGLVLISFISLIVCCKAQCDLRKQNIQYQQLSG